MKIIKTITEFREYRKGIKGSVSFVPTMGYLHEGHMSLVKMARKECDKVIVSIFVNPTQFAPNEDLDAYPRDFEKDEKMCEEEGVDAIFYPSEEEMYPGKDMTWVIVEDITKKLEGEKRPTHFKGVTTVVTKLFNIVQPDKAFFGQKDFQQSVVIKKMAKDLNMPIEIIVCPIIREKDGLAISSRNKYLTEEERKAAPIIREALQLAKQSREKDPEKLKNMIKEKIETKITKEMGKIDYIAITDTKNLDPVKEAKNGDVISLAVFVGKARLIDNIIL